jgi:hypothetical protein
VWRMLRGWARDRIAFSAGTRSHPLLRRLQTPSESRPACNIITRGGAVLSPKEGDGDHAVQFLVLNPKYSRQDSLGGGSALHKTATYTQDNTKQN